jgi:ribosomal-protein-alanine N-acetyltransferase
MTAKNPEVPGSARGLVRRLRGDIEGQYEVEIAYLLDKRYWRQGLASEAAEAIKRYAFNQLNLSRLICLIDPDNQASQGVALKIGMHFEKEVVDEFGLARVYAIAK